MWKESNSGGDRNAYSTVRDFHVTIEIPMEEKR